MVDRLSELREGAAIVSADDVVIDVDKSDVGMNILTQRMVLCLILFIRISLDIDRFYSSEPHLILINTSPRWWWFEWWSIYAEILRGCGVYKTQYFGYSYVNYTRG